MGWRSERVSMSSGRLLAVVLGAAIALSLFIHGLVAIGYAVLTRGVPERLLVAMLLLVPIGLLLRLALAVAHLIRRRRRLRRRRLRQ